MKLVKKIATALLVVLVLIQFIRPAKNTDTSEHLAVFLAETNPPEPVREILNAACMDCHSNHTEYPWYNQVAPISFWIADHVKHGKGHLNFSEWQNYESKRKDHKLEEVVETLESGFMPLKEYTWTHQSARLTNEQRNAVMLWAKNTRMLYNLGNRPE
ncbi:MAG: hypothetical protein RLZZ241_2010 [Bacteroidota bacterium]|jgi:hypothetical protein